MLKTVPLEIHVDDDESVFHKSHRPRPENQKPPVHYTFVPEIPLVTVSRLAHPESHPDGLREPQLQLHKLLQSHMELNLKVFAHDPTDTFHVIHA